MVKKSFIVLIVLSVCNFVNASSGSSAGFMPDDCVVFLNIDNFQQFNTQFKKTNIYGLWTDPAMKAFVGDIEKKVKEQMAQAGEFYDFMTDPNLSAKGKIAAGVVIGDNIIAGQDAAIIILAEFGDNIKPVKQKLDKLAAKMVEQGALRTKKTIEGVEVVKIIKQISKPAVADGDEPNISAKTADAKMEIAYCFIGDMLVKVIDGKDELAGFVISRIKGAKSLTLAENADFVKTMAAVEGTNTVEIFINVKSIIKTALKEDSQGATMQMLDALGLMSLGGVGIKVEAMPKDGINLSGKMFISTEGQRKGILKILEFKNKTVTVPNFVNAAANSFTIINWDAKQGYNEFSKMLSVVSPQYAMMFNIPIPKQDGSGAISIADDIFAYLNPEMVFVEDFGGDMFYDSQTQTTGLMAVSISDKAKLESSLSALHWMYAGMAGGKDLNREFMGYNLYLFDASEELKDEEDVFSQAEDEKSPIVLKPQDKKRFGFTLTDTHLILAAEEELEKAVRLIKNRQATGLSSQKWFVELKTTVPDLVGAAGFKNDRTAMEKAWDMIKKMSVENAKKMSNPFMESSIDLSKLPDFATVKKYFGLTSSYMISREDGFYAETKSIINKQ